jgi:hypothetical protein
MIIGVKVSRKFVFRGEFGGQHDNVSWFYFANMHDDEINVVS